MNKTEKNKIEGLKPKFFLYRVSLHLEFSGDNDFELNPCEKQLWRVVLSLRWCYLNGSKKIIFYNRS